MTKSRSNFFTQIRPIWLAYGTCTLISSNQSGISLWYLHFNQVPINQAKAYGNFNLVCTNQSGLILRYRHFNQVLINQASAAMYLHFNQVLNNKALAYSTCTLTRY
jgi:hypothetical protein